jgi:uncharacterized protein
MHEVKMRPSEALKNNIDEVRRIIENSCAYNPRIFGSVARGEDTENSDLDLLVDVKPQTSLFEFMSLAEELKKITNINVDLVTENALADGIKEQILADAIIL